jgi:putative transferase (TIGR04331 family)
LRLYRRDWGWDHRERVRELAPDARFDDPSRPLSKRLRESRLAVFDCPSTPMLEAFAAGVPSILCWAEDAWPFRPSARPFFEGLREAGVLFESPEEAAAQVGRAYGNPKGWWDEPARLAARRALTATYALSRADWLGSWLKELLQETRA